MGATPDHNVAAIVSFGFYLLWNLFSGFVIPRTVSASFLILERASANMKLNSKRLIAYCLICNRECQYGGDGFSGFVLSLGLCVAW